MATIKDIADEVGISKAAVSRILNHKGSFSNDTIKKVERAAKRLNYKTINMLMEENSAENKSIAVVFPTTVSANYGVFTSLIEQAAYDYGYDIWPCSSLFENCSEEEFFQEMKKKNVSGILLGTYVKDGAALKEKGIPVVTVGFTAGEGILSVSSDNYSCGRIAARHLLGKGCHSLLYITRFPEGVKYDPKYKGFLEEAQKNGAQVWPYQVDLDMDFIHDAPGIMTEMVMEHPEADGVFSETFRLASVLYKTYMDIGYKIPQDIKIIGYGNDYMSVYSSPRLTIVKENIRQIASRAVAVLIDQVENEEPQDADKELEIKVPVSLEVAQTT